MDVIKKIKDNPKIVIGIVIGIVIVGGVIMSSRSSCPDLSGDWNPGWITNGVWASIGTTRLTKKSGSNNIYETKDVVPGSTRVFSLTVDDDCKNIDITENGNTRPWGTIVNKNTMSNLAGNPSPWEWRRKV